VLEDGPVALNNSSAEELAWFIADWAAGVANSYGDAAKILDQSLLDGAKKLTEAIQNALGGLKAAFELLSLINGVLEDGPVALNNSSAEELAWFIADWAAGVANSYGDAAQVLNQSLLDGAKKLTEAIQNTLGGLKAAFELLSLINGVLEDGPVALDNSSAEELAWFIADWAAGVANSYGDAAQVLNQSLTDGAKKLTEAIQNALGGLKAAVETVQLISGVANAETPLVFNAGYETWAANLGTWGARLANAFAGATSIFNAALAPAAKVMADALATAFEGLKAAVELVALISGVANAEEPLTFGETFEAWATNLGQWGVKLTNAFNGATSIFNAALAPAAKVMADAMKSALDGLMAAVQLVTLISAVANAEKPLTFGPAYETWATNLGQWGAKLANAFASATATFNAALAPAAKVMADALKNALDGLVAALGIVRLVEGVVNAEQPPTFGPTFETWAANLGLWGAKLANAFAASTNVFNATLAPAAKVMADGLAVAFSGLKAALDLVRLIAGAQGAEQPVTFNEGMVTLATNLGQWGARLANAFADATGIFDATVAPTAKVMADTIQTALEGIRATIQLLQSLSGFQAEPVQNIEALISLAQVLSAYAARLGSAFATAASGFDSVINNKIKTLNKTLSALGV
jgi:dsDNA-binding SOS-regulon protein